MNGSSKKIRVAVLYRVIQDWRLPVFERISSNGRYDLKVFCGCDFKRSKVISSSQKHRVNAKQMWSIPLKIRTRNGMAFMPFSPFLFFELIRYSPDVILCEGASNLFNNMFAYFYAFLFKRKTIQWGLGQIKGRNKSTIRKILDPIIEFLERTSNACLAYSSIGKLYYANIGVTSEKTFVAVNVVDTELRKHEIKRLDRAQIYTDSHSTSRFNVLFVGAMEKTKRVDILISAFSRLETKYHSAVSLTLVGDGVERKNLQTLSEKLGVKNVRFVGKTMEGVNKYFLGADVFVLPGLGGLAVSDAMVHGLPVIASIGDGCEKDLLSCGAGIIDEGLDEQSLFEHLDRIYQNPAELSKMRRDAIKTIDSKYNIENYIANIERCIDYAYTH